MSSCGEVTTTELGLYNNKRIKDLVHWIEGWPPGLWNTTKAKARDRAEYRQQVSGAAINLPTSQPSQRKPLTPSKNVRKKVACDTCGKLIEANKVAKDKHARTHLPDHKKRRKGKVKEPGDDGQQGGAAVPGG